MANYISNAFSINMLAAWASEANIRIRTTKTFTGGFDGAPVAVNSKVLSFVRGAKSVIGHADIARIVSDQLGVDVPFNRESVGLEYGDVLLVAQYIGPRLPEGATELPEDARIDYVWVSIDDPYEE